MILATVISFILTVPVGETELKDTLSQAFVESSVKQNLPLERLATPVSTVYLDQMEDRRIDAPKKLSAIIPNLHIPDYGSSMRKLDASMRIWQGADLTRKAYTTLFMKSPFSVRDGRADITKKAEAWLAAAKDDGDPPIDAGLAGDICSAVVFALREGEDEKPDLAPSFERSRRPVITSRIVNVEVFQ